MPQLKLALNDKIHHRLPDRPTSKAANGFREHFKLHQCVRQGIQAGDVLSFIPPDGEFELMSYRLPVCPGPPLRVKTAMTTSGVPARTEYAIRLEAVIKPENVAKEIQLRIPLPEGASDVTFCVSHGRANLVGVVEAADVSVALQWEMGQLRGGRECELVVSFVCPPKRFAPLARVGGLPAMDLQFMLP